MVDRAFRLLIVLSVMIGLLVSLGPRVMGGTLRPLTAFTGTEDPIKQAVERELARTHGQDPQVAWQVDTVHWEDKWAYAFFMPISRETGQLLPTEPQVALLGQTTDGVWIVTLSESRQEYLDWLRAIPTSLLPDNTKDHLRPPRAAADDGILNVSGYLDNVRFQATGGLARG